MSFVHDVLKIKYSELGYLANYPYHLISNKEMCDAFLPEKSSDESEEAYRVRPCYFNDRYPCPSSEFDAQYIALRNNIASEIAVLRNSVDEDNIICPDWVYSYMLGATISSESDAADRHTLLVLLNLDNQDDTISLQAYQQIYHISSRWVAKTESNTLTHRVPTIFGEPHVIKSLRLTELDLISGKE